MAAATRKWNGYSLELEGYTQLKPGAYYYFFANDYGSPADEVPLLYCGYKPESGKPGSGKYIFKTKSDNDENINFGAVYSSMPDGQFIKFSLFRTVHNDESNMLILNEYKLYRITGINDQQTKYTDYKKESNSIIFSGGKRKNKRTQKRQSRKKQRKSTRKMHH